jgi:hypothetical protein
MSRVGRRGESKAPIDLSTRHYHRLFEQPAEGEHPVDRLVSRLPHVAAVDRTVATLAEQMRDPRLRADQGRWIAYEDCRLRQRTIHEERFFDAGYLFGHLAGRADAAAVAEGREAGAFASRLRVLVSRARLSATEIAVILLETARGLLLPVQRSTYKKRR